MATDRPFASDQEDDECHHDVVDVEGADPTCWKCGEINPDEETE